ncbi:alcohol dehydrogenase [Thermus thermamylovorans]|uniref:Alcohol dehydrogenase n=2 Tax=Thermus thermamylovorans TaxID=2509362 RepID=A0A4Q9B4X8_9DEIN|nr:alcohol dehydrogenase [Thermus thermamylovorans]
MTEAFPKTMRAWVLGGPWELVPTEKPVPMPGSAEVLIKIQAVAICGTDLEILEKGLPAQVDNELPFHKGLVIGHEYVGTVVSLGPDVDEFQVGDRVAVEVHAGCGRCERCRQGMYTSCLNYSRREKGHRANGLTTDGGFAEYVVNHVNTVHKIPEHIPWDEATLIVTAGTAMYAIDVLGGLVAGDTLVVVGPGPIGLMAVACAKALGARVILTGTRDNRLELGRSLGADYVINVKRQPDVVEEVRRLTNGFGADLVIECSGAPNAVNEGLWMLKRGGRICLAAFSHEPPVVDTAYMVRNNIYMYGIRGEGQMAVRRAIGLVEQGRLNLKPLVTHRFRLDDLPQAIRTARERAGDAIKVVVLP